MASASNFHHDQLQKLTYLLLADDAERLHLTITYDYSPSSIGTLCEPARQLLDVMGFRRVRPDEIDVLPAKQLEEQLSYLPERLPVCQECSLRLPIMRNKAKRT
jgi:hypothetical protein